MAACVARTDGVQIAAVDDDFHHRTDILRQLRLCRGVVVQQRAKLFVSARNREAIFAACLRSAAGDAAGERHDDAGTSADGRHARLRGSQCGILVFAHEPQIAAHQSVRVTQPPVEDELAAERGNPPHLATESFDPLLESVAEIGDFPAHVKIFCRVDEIEARGRGAGEHILADPDECRSFQGLAHGPCEIAAHAVAQSHRGDRPASRTIRSPPGPTYRSSPASQSHMMVLEAFPVAACTACSTHRSIASSDQELDIDAAESLGVGVIDQRRMASATRCNGQVTRFDRPLAIDLGLRTSPVR